MVRSGLLFILVILFSGCAQNINELSQTITDKVETAFLIEKDLKVGVSKAYVSSLTDAKSKRVCEVKLDEELKVIGLKDNDEWYQVLTPSKEGYIPKSAMIDVTVGDSLAKLLTFVWDKTKNKEYKAQTTFEAKNKKWSDHEKQRRSIKGFADSKISKASKPPRYDQEYMNLYFTNISKRVSSNTNSFRNSGGLN